MRLGILTCGGDCAGLNAAIRAVVRTADYRFGAEVVGYQRGGNGVTDGDSIALNPEAVRGILPRGGTMLGTSRSRPELIAAGADPLIAQLNSDGVEALVAIGGDGTLMATNMLHEAGFPVVDRLHTSAASHDRVMVLEVMGRHAGHLAAGAGIAGGAAAVLVPEEPFDIDTIAGRLAARHGRGRSASIVVVAEGATPRPGTVADFDPGVDQWGRPRVGGVGELVGHLIASRSARS
ncbi:MAG: 6-phosphofructokinase [Acidimicrobiales bacterium]